jgi:hypothetical protein
MEIHDDESTMKVLSLLDTVFWMMVGFGSMMSSGFFEGLRKTMMIVSELRSGLGDNYWAMGRKTCEMS